MTAVLRLLRALVVGPLPLLMLVSAAGWAVVLWRGDGAGMSLLCGVGRPPVFGLDGRSFGAWLIMLAAMTPVLLAEPLGVVWSRTLARRRCDGAALFVAGYLAIWMAAGVGLTAVAVMITTAAGSSSLAAFALAVAAAGLWRLTPAWRRCLELCHLQPHLNAVGRSAGLSRLRYGADIGLWCVGACWPLMLAPLLAGRWHIQAMAAAYAVMLADRYLGPWPLSDVGTTVSSLIQRAAQPARLAQ